MWRFSHISETKCSNALEKVEYDGHFPFIASLFTQTFRQGFMACLSPTLLAVIR